MPQVILKDCYLEMKKKKAVSFPDFHMARFLIAIPSVFIFALKKKKFNRCCLCWQYVLCLVYNILMYICLGIPCKRTWIQRTLTSHSWWWWSHAWRGHAHRGTSAWWHAHWRTHRWPHAWGRTHHAWEGGIMFNQHQVKVI